MSQREGSEVNEDTDTGLGYTKLALAVLLVLSLLVIEVLRAAKGYKEVCRTLLLAPLGKNRAWAAPAFANRHAFARNDQELICVSLVAKR